MSFGRQDKKPETPKQSTLANPLKILLKRKRADEYVIEKFQVPEELPKNEAKVPSGQHGPGSGIGSDGNISDPLDSENFSFDLTAESAANFNVGPTFSDPATGLDGSAVVSSGNASGLASTDSIAVASGLVIEGLPTSADIFDIGATGADGTDLEGILQNLSGASHLPPGIVPGGSALDFDAGLGMLLRLLVPLSCMCCGSILNLTEKFADKFNLQFFISDYINDNQLIKHKFNTRDKLCLLYMSQLCIVFAQSVDRTSH